ncbi:uncharacterized protein BJ171DRAFT_496791 [Polychytrium aggregatum]|uniref:uncharacterized protein n=1 Tax=Polychytrium aggregatum TaxID=110093 RepID=UPI0022FDFAC6|nr:uncharacterized protein BJ171DRAFT_496791 [Polychytrium aggregatum]KAI9206737.1 hypothetical protein BJ171DRAFT_496791 [Polychytrium aggregatum]
MMANSSSFCPHNPSARSTCPLSSLSLMLATHTSPPAVRLAKHLEQIGYCPDPKSTSAASTTTESLVEILEWIFEVRGAERFLDWVLQVLSDPGCYGVLTLEEVEALREVRDMLGVDIESARDFDLSVDGDPNDSEQAIEIELQELQAQLTRLEQHEGRLTAQQERLNCTKAALQSQIGLTESALRQIHESETSEAAEIERISISVDSTIHDTINELTETLAHLSADGDDKRDSLFFYHAIEDFGALIAEHEQLSKDLEDLCESWFNTMPMSEDTHDYAANLSFGDELARLESLYTGTEQNLLDSQLKLIEAKTTLEVLQEETQRGLQTGFPVAHVCERKSKDYIQASHDLASTIEKTIQARCLPVWSEKLAHQSTYQPILQIDYEMRKAQLQQEYKDYEQVKRLYLEQQVHLQLLTLSLEAEKHRFRRISHTLQSIISQLEERKTQIEQRRSWINSSELLPSSAEASTFSSSDVFLQSIDSALNGGMPANQTDAASTVITSVTGLYDRASALVVRHDQARENLAGLVQQLAKQVDEIETLQSSLWKHTTRHRAGGKILLAPKELYRLQGQVQQKVRELPEVVQKATEALRHMKQ